MISDKNRTLTATSINSSQNETRKSPVRSGPLGLMKIGAGVLLCLALFVAPVLAAGSQIAAPSAAIDGEVILPIMISGVTSSPGVSLLISYDPTQLQVLDIIRNTSISGTQVSAKNINATTGTINVIIINTASSITADSPLGLADLRFRPLQNGSSAIKIINSEWSDAGFMPIAFDSVIDGTIVVGTPPVVSVSASTTAASTYSYYYEDVPTTVAPVFISPTNEGAPQENVKPEVSPTQKQGTIMNPTVTSVPGQDIVHMSSTVTAVTTDIPTTMPTQKSPGFSVLTFAVLCIGGAVLSIARRK